MAAEPEQPPQEPRDTDVERSTHLARRFAVVYAVLIVGGGTIALLLGLAGDDAAQYAAAALIGGGVGVGELVSRYRDRPWKALRTLPAIGYVLINAAASIGALVLILTFDWEFGADGDAIVATQLLVAGFGSMALFRTSLFTVRAGDQDVGIGPSSLLSIILAACDRGVDRERAKDRAIQVGEIMANVSFERAHGPLPTVALALMQNLEAPDQAALGLQVEKLSNDDEMSDSAKSLLLGLAISNAVGPHVLQHAKNALGEDILRPPTESPPEGGEVSEREAFDHALQRVLRRVRGGEGEASPEVAPGAPEIPGSDAQERDRPEGLPQTPQTPG